MRKFFIAMMLLAFSALTAMAQDRNITGTLLDKESKEPVLQATVQLLKASDSTYVAGTVSDAEGNFRVVAPENGKYIIKFTNIGYKQLFRNVTISEDRDFAFGKVNMETDAVMLKEVIANGVAAKVIVKEDTFIYNAAAYRTPEGSVIEELVKRLPGAEIDDNGKITINGKEVKKIKVDGKEFMTGDTQTALKNLPTSIVEKVKAYDEKSDLARMTGIDDGEESTVLDFGIKRGMNKGFMSNVDLAYGTHNRYAGRVMGAYMKDNQRFMVFGNINNTSDRGFNSGGRGGGGGGNGLRASRMFGANYNYNKKDKLTVDFSVRWNHSGSDTWTASATENFISRAAAFSNSRQQNYGRSNSWNLTGRVEWKPDTLTTIAIRPNFTASSNDSRSMSANASFKQDPLLAAQQYFGTQDVDPLDSLYMIELNKIIYKQSAGTDSLLINRRDNNSLSYGTNSNFNIQATVSRRLSSQGRNLTVQGRFASSNSDNESVSTQLVHLYRPYLDGEQVMSDADSLYYRNRYNVTPNRNRSFQVSATYSEPIARATFLQLRYQYQYRNTYSDRQTHDFSRFPGLYPVGLNASQFGMGITPQYRNFGAYLNPFVTNEHPLAEYLDSDQSRFSEYDNYIHEVELTLRRTTNNYNLNVGVMVQPQVSDLHYKHLGIDTIARRTVTNFTPTLDFRYRWTKQKSIRLNYRGSTSQPSMTDLMPITDDSNPLNITKGNPDLKPSFTSTFRLQYNNYVQNHMRTVMSYINFGFTNNSVANMVTYNDRTGGRTTQPMNINGNWNINSAFMFNTAVDSVGRWNINSFTNVSYNNRVSYVTLQKMDENGKVLRDPVSNNTLYEDPTKNYTRSTSLSERLGGSYRNEWLEVEVNGNVTYNINRNKLQPNSNNDTWHFSYGTDITVTLPWGMSIATGAHMESRRGYSEAAANTNEFVWNAQISQGFFKGKPLTISAQFNDILNKRSSFSRNITANSRVDTYYNSINSYCMFHAIYRFNAFGGKAARQQNRGDRGEGVGPEGIGPMGEGPGGNRGGGQRGNRGGGSFSGNGRF